jgi:hypothetical protein
MVSSQWEDLPAHTLVCKPRKQQKDFRPQEVLHPQVKPFDAHLCFFKILSCSSSASYSSEVPLGTHCELSTGGCLLTTSSMAHFSFHTPCPSTYKLNGVVSFCTPCNYMGQSIRLSVLLSPQCNSLASSCTHAYLPPGACLPPSMKHFLSQSLYFWGTKFSSIFSMYLNSTIH